MTDRSAPTAGVDDRVVRRLTLARWIVVGSFGFLALMVPAFVAVTAISSVQNGHRPIEVAVLAVVLSLPLGWQLLRMVQHRLGSRKTRSSFAFWSSLGLLAAVAVCLDLEVLTLMAVGLWWSVAVLVADRRLMIVVSAVLLVLPWVRFATFEERDPWLMLVIWTIPVVWAPIMLAANHAVLLLWDVANEAHAAREAQARLAVSEERLRFARDLHDLLGHSLSGVAVKSELAARLAQRDPDRAAAEMVQVQQLAREALREVRAAVSGYRDVDLAAELASVRAVLQAGGTRCTLTGADVGLTPEQRTTVAWVCREGATNVLRHSSARRCDLSLAREERAVVVEMFNDGARGSAGQVQYGNGLTGLTERVAAVGGTLSARPVTGGGFLLRAVLPAEPAGAPEARPAAGTERKDVAA
ncbi:sensor histidine kinase [Marinactinospora rubrisoli]|uniref:Sensor histidine kinase n=1 Tax=Marinactinospora rubrisoli TaxID=2715399 RepID=A0ABW2KAY4_9ACTN